MKMFPTSVTNTQWTRVAELQGRHAHNRGPGVAFDHVLSKVQSAPTQVGTLNPTVIDHLARTLRQSLTGRQTVQLSQGGQQNQAGQSQLATERGLSSASWSYAGLPNSAMPNGGILPANAKQVKAAYVTHRSETHTSPGRVEKVSLRESTLAMPATEQSGHRGMSSGGERQEQAAMQVMRSEAQRVAELTGRNTIEQKSVTTSKHVPHADLIHQAAQINGLDERMLRAVVYVGSHFDAGSISSDGGQGLMNLRPELISELGVQDPLNAEENIMAGSAVLKSLMDRYQGHRDLALAAFQWGPTNLERDPNSIPQNILEYVERVSHILDGDEASHVLV
uniref:Putative GH23: distantly related to lytic murein transglycosylase n=1 Tax=Magnetococcus massalia (strain MO-1) TaxID=451514 RepID=A0A1S7LPY6_MAGMO|nr:putative GH23 : distantly related to lytic murein transglycosylase [Candidatus Magnetococcus massalia]